MKSLLAQPDKHYMVVDIRGKRNLETEKVETDPKKNTVPRFRILNFSETEQPEPETVLNSPKSKGILGKRGNDLFRL